MNNISGFGLRVVITASNTFPNGFTISAFADDSDPFDFPELTTSETAMGLNGDQLAWNNANPVAVTLNVIPNSEDDRNLDTLFSANRAARGRQSAQDEITMSGIYPDGSTVELVAGVTTTYIPSSSVASAGRLKSKPYNFSFEDVTNNRA